jgi:EmrB/QacA subfamily drug resistance transporter
VTATLPRAQLTPVLAAMLLGTLMSSLSQLIVTTALPVVVGALGGIEVYSWVFAAALLTSTVTVPIAGKLSDLFGRKTIYLIGITIFIAGSALAGAAHSIGQLIVFRAVQGIGAGCVQPSVSALLADIFPAEQRGRWQGVNGAIWGLSSVLGPALGGYLAEHVSWRWVFYVNLPPGIVAAGLMAHYLPAGMRRAERPAIDYLGMGLLSGALVSLLLTTVWGGHVFPWLSVETLGLVLLAAIFFTAFLARERHAPEPIVPLDLFRNRTYRTLIILLFLTGVGLFGAITYVPLYLQAVLGISPTASGLLFLPTVLAVGLTGVVVSASMHRIGYRRVALSTMAAGAAGFVLLAAMGPGASVLPIVVGLSVIGGAIGLSFPVFIVIAQNTVPRETVGVATSLVQLTRSLGGTIGVAVLGAYLIAQLGPVLAGSAAGQGEITALIRPDALASLSAAQASYLREQLAAAMRGLFTFGALAMGVATLLALRLEDRPRQR